MSDVEKIILVGDFDYNEQQVLKAVVAQIHQESDLDGCLIQEWLNGGREGHQFNFAELLIDNDRSCYEHIINMDNPLLDKLMSVNQSMVGRFVDKHLVWEKQFCGHVLDQFANGYIKYCDQHQYLHSKDSKIKDHQFVKKTDKEIMDQQIFKVRFNQYLELTRILAKKMIFEFYGYLDLIGYQTYYSPIENKDQIIGWLKDHPRSFRSIEVIYPSDLEKVIKEKQESEKVYLKNRRALKALKEGRASVYRAEQAQRKKFEAMSKSGIFLKISVAPEDIKQVEKERYLISKSRL